MYVAKREEDLAKEPDWNNLYKSNIVIAAWLINQLYQIWGDGSR